MAYSCRSHGEFCNFIRREHRPVGVVNAPTIVEEIANSICFEESCLTLNSLHSKYIYMYVCVRHVRLEVVEDAGISSPPSRMA